MAQAALKSPVMISAHIMLPAEALFSEWACRMCRAGIESVAGIEDADRQLQGKNLLPLQKCQESKCRVPASASTIVSYWH